MTESPWADTALAAALVVVALVLRLAFRYGEGFGDANIIHMATGMARGAAHSLPLGETLEYGKNFSLGVYVGFRVLYPLFFGDASSTAAFLNAVGLMAGSLVYAPLYFLFRSTLPRAASLAAAIVVMLAPVVWENETYFQPITLALLFFLVALSCARRMASTPAGMLWGTAAYLFGLASVLSRAEIVLGIPALLLASARLGGRRRLLQTAGLTLAVGVTTLALLRGMGSGTQTQGSDLGPYVRAFLATYIVPASALRNLIWGALGIGIVSLAVGAWGLVRGRALPSATRVDLPSLIVWMGTILLFWMWNPVPLLRHYYLMVPALAWLLGELVFRQGSMRRAVLLAAVIGAANLALPELLYGVQGARSQGPPKTPHGTFFSWHAHKTKDVDRVREFARETVSLVRQRQAEGAEGAARRLVLQMNWEQSGYVQYGLAAAGVRVDVQDAGVLEPGVVLKDYHARGLAVREVRCNWLVDPEARRVVRAELERAAAEGIEIVLSREAAERLELDSTWSALVSIF